MPIIRVDDLSKTYRLGDQDVTALEGVSLTVEEGVFMAIAGPSGSGKSTLLNIMGCIDTPSKGRVEIEGKDVSGQSPDDLADVRENDRFHFSDLQSLACSFGLRERRVPPSPDARAVRT